MSAFDTHPGNEPLCGAADMVQNQIDTSETGAQPLAWAQDCVGASSAAPPFNPTMANSQLIAELGLGHYLGDTLAGPVTPVSSQVQPEAGASSSVDTAVASRGRGMGFQSPATTFSVVTREMLVEWLALGRDGIEKAGGLPALADEFGVRCATLRNYVFVDGTLTPAGQRVIRE